MKRHLHYFISSVLLLVSSFSSGQHTKSDRLLQLLRTQPADTARVNTLNELAGYYRPSDLNRATGYANEALQLSQKLNYEKGSGYALTWLGVFDKKGGKNQEAIQKYRKAMVHFRQAKETHGLLFCLLEMAVAQKSEGDFDASYRCYQEMDSLSALTNDTVYMIEARNGYANVYRYKDDYTRSLQYYISAVKLANTAGQKGLEAISLTNMAIIYSYQRKTDDELKVITRAVSLMEDIKDTVKLITLYSYLGNIHSDKQDYAKAEREYIKARDIVQKFGPERAGYNSLSEIYMNFAELSTRTGKLGEAVKNYLSSLDWAKRSNDKKRVSNAWGYLAAAYYKTKQITEAEAAAREQITLAEEMDYKRGVMEASNLLSEIYSVKGDYKNAFAFHKQYALLKDDLLNEEGLKQMSEMQTKYETEKKDKELIRKDAEILRQNADTKQRETERNAFIAGCILMIALAFLIFRSARQKQRANKLLESKNQIILAQKGLVEEKQKETLDSIRYAQRIQLSLLPTEKYIEKTLRRLMNQ